MSQVSRVSINLQFSHEQESEKNDSPEVEYLWGRIFVSIIVFAVIASLVLWFVVKPSEPMAVQNLSIAASETVEVNHAVAALPQETSIATPSLAAIDRPKIEAEEINQPVVAIESPENDSVVMAHQELINRSEATSENHDDALQPTVAENTVEGDDEGAALALNMTADPAPTASPVQPENVKLADIQIKSSHVNNAQLSLENKPTAADSLPAVVYVNADKVLKAHFLTDYRSLKGQQVYHDWYLNNKRVARVSTRPAKDKQMAFSSKNIDNTMAGSWQVKVVDQRNTLLAIGEFEVQQLH